MNLKKANQMYDDFKVADDHVCALFNKIDALIENAKDIEGMDGVRLKLRTAKRHCEHTMMRLIEAKERMK